MIPKGFKTVLFNLIMFVGQGLTIWLGVDTEEGVTVLQENVDMIIAGITAIWTVGNVWLRAVTDSPIFKKV